jgi:phage tail protein X
MADSFIPYQDPAITSRKLDSESLVVGANTVERERMQLVGRLAAQIAEVLNAAPGLTDYALVVRNIPSGTQLVDGSAVTQPVSGVFFQATQPVSAVNLDIRDLVFATDKADVSGSAVDVASSALPAGASTAALQLPDGHNVTVDNAAGAAAVNIQDGGNSITVDGIVTTTPGTPPDLAPSAPTFATVGVASASAVAANAARKGLALVNTSNARISLGFGSAAVLDSGITLFAGDALVMDERSFDLGTVNAIASAAASNLGVQEYV